MASGLPPPDPDPDVPAPTPPVRGLWPLFVSTFFLAAGGGLVFPLLAELQDAHGLPTWGLGVVAGLFFVGSIIGQLGFAPLGDRGHARRLLVVGVLLNLLALLWFAFGTELWQFTAARGLAGLATGMFLPAARASLVRADPARTGQLLGRFAGTETGGFMLGPVIGTAIYQLFGLKAPFLVVAAVMVAVLVVLLRSPLPGTKVVRPTDPATSPPRTNVLSSFALLRYRGVVVAVLLQLSVFLPVGIYESLWARYLTDRGATTLLIGFGLTLYGLPFILAAPRGGRLADRIGPVRSSTIGMLVVIPATAAYGLLAAPLLITAMALIEAVGNATAVPGAQTAMARSCPRERLTAGQGLSGAVSMLGAGFAAVVAAPVYEAFGGGVLFTGAGVLMGMLVAAAQIVDRWGGNRAVPHPFDIDATERDDPARAHLRDVDTPVGPVPLDPTD
jgi:MFS family permease